MMRMVGKIVRMVIPIFCVALSALAAFARDAQDTESLPLSPVQRVLAEPASMFDVGRMVLEQRIADKVRGMQDLTLYVKRGVGDPFSSASANVMYLPDKDQILISVSATADMRISEPEVVTALLRLIHAEFTTESALALSLPKVGNMANYESSLASPFYHSIAGGEYNLGDFWQQFVHRMTFSVMVSYMPRPFEGAMLKGTWSMEDKILKIVQ